MITFKCDMWLGFGPNESILGRPGIEQANRDDTDKIVR